ncbi:serine/threonine-protein kinase VRK3 isoform X2 [Archocentrus centrarchus]|uniref:serine/threonine-protein kinase VRK3 isoform X2 n=1 Tax=Archocentrus centrarchus TaxID=63155 RepID=UPI0011E9C006|nr:inactive serine/threonine-protein kinase VRK3 isoform X2 [Archocentrus centrarchus]
MPFKFCPHCGTELQPEFRFCPSCGEKRPSPESPRKYEPVSSSFYSPPSNAAATSVINISPTPSTSCEPTDRTAHASDTLLTPRPALRKTRNTLRLDREDNGAGLQVSPPKKNMVTFKLDTGVQPIVVSPVAKSPQSTRGKGKFCGPVNKQQEEEEKKLSAVGVSSPVSSPVSKSPVKAAGKNKAKKAKHATSLEPLPEGEEVTDTTGKKWKLIKQLSQSTTELLYEVSRPNSKDSDHVLKLGAKDGRIFNEQNFLQRAAKPALVEKWIKQNKLDFLGIPSCVGFGLHTDSYRFLIFPSMGRSLHSIIEEENEPLPEKVVLQLAYRILDVLQYIHSNEYVHADISAENIYIKQGQKSQVSLVGYCHAFRYCPGGKHVEYREASRTPHEGTVQFISLDAHKGAAPSRRSDLQSLGYCMLHWHTRSLPWIELTQPHQVATQKQRYMEDVSALLSHCFRKKSISTFQTYLTAVMALQYTEQPDYAALKAGFTNGLEQLGASVEEPFGF